VDFKSYYGSSIREALQAARQELGPEAAILASRQTEDGSGRYEVVCGVVPALGRLTESKPVARRIPAAARQPEPVAIPEKLAQPSGLRRKLQGVREALRPSRDDSQEAELNKLWLSLMADGFDEELVNEILTGVRRRVRGLELPLALLDELDSRTKIDAALGRGSGKRRITALVGPPGAGKTTLLVKLAVRYGLKGRGPMRLISLDAAWVGGTDGLERYASGMAVGLDIVETGMSLAQAVEAQPEAGLILIDTPGLSPSDMPAAQEYMNVLARHPEIDVQLVIPATMSPANMKSTFERYRPLLPSRIAITCTDLAVSSRPAVGLAIRHEVPLSFAGTGPGVPEDLIEASVPALLRSEQKLRSRSAVSAA
jgi:flagellar biosynthesis protein FlhF